MSPTIDWREALAVQGHGATVLSSLKELREASSSMTGRHAVEIAWKQMRLDGVISLGDAPIAYVRRVTKYDEKQEADLHRLHWLNSTAPLLLIVDDEHLRSYSARPPRPGKIQGKQACIQVLDLVSDALEVQYLLEHVRTGTFFAQHKEHFRFDNGADRRLLEQLRRTRNALWSIDKSIDLSEYHSLLVRILFLRYLQDRTILDRDFFASYLQEKACSLFEYLSNHAHQPQRALSRIFSELAHRLGIRELQDTSRTFTEGRFTEEHFDLISRFLRDEDVKSGQLSMGAWKYDLSLLPVELISAVYQEFIYDEVPTAKRDLGLVPTPRFLAEVVLSLAFEGIANTRPRILDPACGSGIFLVGCFNRLAHEWRKENDKAPALKTYRALKNILAQSLAGVELKETACELARLNLLHALLHQVRNPSLRTIMRQADTEPAVLLPATNIHSKSFFDPSLEIQQHGFDLVIGNPPWSKDKIPNWKRQHPNRPIPERSNLVYAFCWVAADFLTENGRACLLLDGKAMLFAPPSRHFAKAWYQAYSIDLIVDLTAFRAVLFRGAGRTAAIFRFRSRDSNEPPTLSYVTPWATEVTSHGGVLDISDAKTEIIRVAEVRRWANKEDLPSFFRPRLYGTSRDQALIDRLRSIGALQQDPCHWMIHQGFNRKGTKRPPLHRELVRDVKFLPTSVPANLCAWGGWLPWTDLTREYGTERNETTLISQWPVDERVFTVPRVIIHHTPLRSPPMIRAAHTDAKFTFHKEILAAYSSKGSADDNRLLAGILMSELAYYYFFQTSLSWGVEAQPQLRQDDIKRFPWKRPSTTKDLSLAQAIIKEVMSLEQAGQKYWAMLEPTRRRISDLVMDYYDLNEWDRDLVRDCIATTADVAFHGGRTPDGVRLAARGHCLAYLERFVDVLQCWSPEREPIGGVAFMSKEAQMGVALFRRNTGAPPEFEALENEDELAQILRRLKSILREHHRPGSASNLMVMTGDDLYITKPLGLRHWTRSAALNDADALAASLVQRRH